MHALDGFGFDAYVSRLAIASLVILCLPTVLRGALVTPPLKRSSNLAFVATLSTGFATAAIVMLFAFASLTALGNLSFHHAPTPRLLINIVTTAFSVASVEEIIFRGLLFVALWRRLSPIGAVTGSAVLFAVLHLVRSSRHGGHVWSGTVTSLTGFARGAFLLSDVLAPWAAPALVATLFVLGSVLALATVRTRNLAYPIGLHAGVVFGLKLQLASFAIGVAPSWWLSPADPRCGLAPLLAMLLLALAVAATPIAWVGAPTDRQTRETV